MEPSQNTAAKVPTNLSLDKVLKQVSQDQEDLPAAIAAVQNAGSDKGLAAAAAVSSLLKQTVTSLPASVQTLDVVTGVAATATATSAAAATQTNDATNNGSRNGRNGNNSSNNSNNSNANTNANSRNGRGNAANNNNRRRTVFFA